MSARLEEELEAAETPESLPTWLGFGDALVVDLNGLRAGREP